MAFFKLFSLLSIIALSAGRLVVHESRAITPPGFVSGGAASAGDMLTLRVALASNNIAGLQDRLMTLSTPVSSEFRRWLSMDEVKSFVQPSPETLEAFTTWASVNRLNYTIVSPNSDWVSFTLPVSQANQLFGANFEVFTHPAMTTSIARTLSVSLPSELVGHVEVLYPTTQFVDPNSLLGHSTGVSLEQRSPSASCNTSDPNGVMNPICLQELYGVPTNGTTKNTNTILVPGYIGAFAQPSDLEIFLQLYRPDVPSNTTFTVTRINGSSPSDPDLVGLEAVLDLEYTIGLAPKVPSVFLSVGGTDFPQALLDTTTFIDGLESPPSVLSTSYGAAESTFGDSMAIKLCHAYMALGARGVSVLFGSGDGGVRGLHDDNTTDCSNNTFIPIFPTSCPYVTSLGGTAGFGPEVALNLTGGGFSNIFAAPPYQTSAVASYLDTIPADFPGTFNRTGRGYPDIALQAWNFEIVNNGTTSLIYGTSAGSPVFAAMLAMINDRLVAAGKPTLGFLNPFIYSTGSAAFTDITSGHNSGLVCPASSVAFDAAVGWDATTGIGTPRFADLLTAAMASASAANPVGH
ncbi:subtilisin-like protein [Mycena metata]|uniref:Subtilisin-like protein n=1 Tax=Mycena metata TaxID=1033252 RepID=A0AAD7J014_9AGAR|nr:subtilisin-like protein [Mycena metata]